MSWFSDIGSFISDNSNILKPIAQIGIGALNQSNADNTQQSYLNYLQSREDNNYNNYLDQIGYANQAGAAGAAAKSAKAAASAATDRNRLAAMLKANTALQANYKKILKLYSPLTKTVNTLLPQKTQTYENALNLENSMGSFLNQPDQVAKLAAPVPIWQQNVPLPDYLKMK